VAALPLPALTAGSSSPSSVDPASADLFAQLIAQFTDADAQAPADDPQAENAGAAADDRGRAGAPAAAVPARLSRKPANAPGAADALPGLAPSEAPRDGWAAAGLTASVLPWATVQPLPLPPPEAGPQAPLPGSAQPGGGAPDPPASLADVVRNAINRQAPTPAQVPAPVSADADAAHQDASSVPAVPAAPETLSNSSPGVAVDAPIVPQLAERETQAPPDAAVPAAVLRSPAVDALPTFLRRALAVAPDDRAAAPGRPAPDSPDSKDAAPDLKGAVPAAFASARNDTGGAAARSFGDRQGQQTDADPQPHAPDAAASAALFRMDHAASAAGAATQSTDPTGAAAALSAASASATAVSHPGIPGINDDRDLSSQIVRAASLQWRNGVGEARIVLKPEYLGEITISLRVEQGGVTAHIGATAPEVRAWMSANEASLRQGLSDQGLTLERLVVSDPQAESEPDSGGRRRESPEEQDLPRPRPPRDSGNFEIIV
jgi:flagellar hook-length control protein FliK